MNKLANISKKVEVAVFIDSIYFPVSKAKDKDDLKKVIRENSIRKIAKEDIGSTLPVIVISTSGNPPRAVYQEFYYATFEVLKVGEKYFEGQIKRGDSKEHIKLGICSPKLSVLADLED